MVDCTKINVKKGSNDENVKEVQKYLKYYNYYDGNIDGSCGNYTVEAIKKFQKANGLKVDGIFGTLSCQKSNINGKDISNSNKDISLAVFKDMLQRYQDFVKTKAKEPNIMYINKEYPYEYVSLKQFVDIKKRYEQFIKDNGREPKTLSINKTTTNTTTTSQPSNTNRTSFTVTHLCEKSGGNCLGQITGYHCGPHSIKQCLRKFGITKYSESTIGSYAGTTRAGTGHGGLETAIAHIAKLEGIKLNVEWRNFSDLGSDQKSRFKKLGELMTDPKKAVFWHEMYRDAYGHYSLARTINISTMYGIIANSLGSKCNSPAFCGYMENRKLSVQERYLSKISQKSICIITKV